LKRRFIVAAVPVVFVTAYDDADFKRAITGPFAYLHKPLKKAS
jgi:DNA-binding LytR/AlgR family response regulator